MNYELIHSCTREVVLIEKDNICFSKQCITVLKTKELRYIQGNYHELRKVSKLEENIPAILKFPVVKWNIYACNDS